MIWKVALMSNADDVRVVGPMDERFDEVLTPEALALLAALHREFDGRRRDLLAQRVERAAKRAAGEVFVSYPRLRRSVWTLLGGSPRRRLGWWIGGWRSPGPPIRS